MELSPLIMSGQMVVLCATHSARGIVPWQPTPDTSEARSGQYTQPSLSHLGESSMLVTLRGGRTVPLGAAKRRAGLVRKLRMNWPRAHAERLSGGHPDGPEHTAARRSLAMARSADRRNGRPKLLSGGDIGAPAVVVKRGGGLHRPHRARAVCVAFVYVCGGVSGTGRWIGVVPAAPAHRICAVVCAIESRTHRPVGSVAGSCATLRV